MIGADSNVVVRYLVEDDRAQTESVHRLLVRAKAAGETVYVSHIVLCETCWVLRAVFNRARADVAAAMELLLELDVFRVEAPDLVRQALASFRDGKGDFADYLIGQVHAARGCRQTATFDRALRGAPGFAVL